MTNPTKWPNDPICHVLVRCADTGELHYEDESLRIAHIRGPRGNWPNGLFPRITAARLVEVLPQPLDCFDATSPTFRGEKASSKQSTVTANGLGDPG